MLTGNVNKAVNLLTSNNGKWSPFFRCSSVVLKSAIKAIGGSSPFGMDVEW